MADATYQAWLAAGHLPTRIATEAELWDVLAVQVPEALPDIPAANDQYAAVAVASLPVAVRVALEMIDKRPSAVFEADLKAALKAKRPKR